MRVQLISKPDRHITGLRRYSDTIERYLASQGVDVRSCSSGASLPGPIIQIAHRMGWDLTSFVQSYPLRQRLESADLYHLTSESLASMLMSQKIDPCVVTVHAFLSYLLRHDPELSIYDHVVQRWFDALAARGLHRAQAIIAVSDYVRSALIEQIGIAEERIYVVHEAVDHTLFRPQDVPGDLKVKYGLPENGRYVLYVGSEQPRKNFSTLLRAFAQVKHEIKDACLLKVGQPESVSERHKALALIAQLGIEKDVLFCGHVEQDLPAFYNLADVFVFPSRYEGFGFPPLEAMACGTPVICSNTTSLPEVVGEAALLFDPMDEDRLVGLMAYVLSDTGIQMEYTQRGIERASRFRWDVTAKKTREVYEQIIQLGKSRN
ncbi:MAG: glycosyltransferase family 4 protein [Anaerolineae bacterium]|nr:glycosyltransferase family 4 protein [Anaerolineae bacterium]